MKNLRIINVFAALALILCAALVHATPVVLQTNAKENGSTSAVTIVLPDMVSALTAGSKLIVAVSMETAGVTGFGVSDNHNGAYHVDADSGTLAGNSGAGGGHIFFASVNNTFTGSGSGFTITVSWTTGSAAVMSVYEVTGAGTFDLAGTAKSGTSTLTALGFTITPSASNEFVVAVGLSNFATGIAVDTGYTFPANDTGIVWPPGLNADNHMHEYIAAATGLQSLNIHGTGTGGASMFGAAYGSSGGAAAALAGAASTTTSATGALTASGAPFAPLTIGLGTTPNDGTGDPARTAFNKLNVMSAQLYGVRSVQTPTTGFTQAPAHGVTQLVLNPSGTLATGTVTFPPAPGDNQPFELVTTQTITALTLNTSDGSTIASAPTTITAAAAIQYRFIASLGIWLREQ